MKPNFYLLILLLIFASSALFAQELPCKSKYENDQCRERYKEDNDGNKHGKYIRYFETGRVHISGNFIHGVMQGNFRIALSPLESLSFKLAGKGSHEYAYFWYEKDKEIAHNFSPISSLAEARLIFAKEENETKKAENLALAVKENAAKKRKEEEIRLREEEAKKAEAERINNLRVNFKNLKEVTLDNIIAAGKAGATQSDIKQVELFKNFLSTGNTERSFELQLGSSDNDVLKAAAFNYLAKNANMDVREVVESQNDYHIIIQKLDGKVNKVSFSNIKCMKINDNTILIMEKKEKDDFKYQFYINNTFKEFTPFQKEYSTLTEDEKFLDLVSRIGRYDFGGYCIPDKSLNHVIARAENLNVDHQKDAGKYLINVILSRGKNLICDNKATDDLEVLAFTYTAYLYWLINEKYAAKKMFLMANSKGAKMRRWALDEWEDCTYSQYINKYFHKVDIQNKDDDKELYRLNIGNDKELSKFLNDL